MVNWLLVVQPRL